MSEFSYRGTMKYNLIYIFAIHDKNHEGYLKIGMTSFDSASSYKQLPPNCDELNKNAHSRIRQYTSTAMIEYELLHTELARKTVLLADGTIDQSTFNDYAVHKVLERAGFDVLRFSATKQPSEWYKVSLPTAIAAIRAVKEGRNTLSAGEKTKESEVHAAGRPQSAGRPKITLRAEQAACVAKTKTVFRKKNRMLWDCKMRFGKTVTAYSLVKEMDYQKVIVVTHRPAVVDGWRSDFDLIFTEGSRTFQTKANIKEEDRFTARDASIDAENDRVLTNLAENGTPFVYFASMQDLRGSKLVGGKFPKNRAVFDMDWDLIIYDEAHEGTQTDLGEKVQKRLEQAKKGKTPKKVLQLSGTPYNLLGQYEDDNVYSWDYVMEQQAKKKWAEDHPGDYNPYAELPEMRICTFDLRERLSTAYRFENENAAFNFREFFRTWTGDRKRDFRPMPEGAAVGDFVYEKDVRTFLDLISTDSKESNYPFATPEYRDMFRHTFWILPGVKEARAFSSMLKKHPVFGSYEIVNVAGEGDVEQPYDDALRAVRDAIRKHDRTITLSCGKLTTGVTVREWTGVMLLSGSASTGAAGYMQTIFRAQSAGSIDGRQKEVCYAFDFAPDRALKVISEIHHLKKNAVGTDDEGRIALGEFLNFCPVLAEGAGGMEFYDVPKMMRQMKRLTVDAAVKNGFDDDSIYKADAGIVMDRDKLVLLGDLKTKLTPQKKGKKQTSVRVNDHGMTDEQYGTAQKAKRKHKRERTKEEEEALEKEKKLKKQQQDLFDLLRNISIRLPLLIYGAAADFRDSVRLEDFVNIVDDASWKEFMPPDVDKRFFKKLLVFYDMDVIEGAGMRIRHMARAADEMYPTQRVMRLAEIFACFRNPAKETVLTPWRVVNMHMGDTVGGYNFYKEGYPMKDGLLEEPRYEEAGGVTEAVFAGQDSMEDVFGGRGLFSASRPKILEMNSKSGLYPLYMAYSLYRKRLPTAETKLSLEEAQAVWQDVLDEELYVLCQTKMAVSITKRTLAGYTPMKTNVTFLTKLLERMQDRKRLANKIRNPKTWEKEGEKMKFDAIVGNPPYQLTGGSGGSNDAPIYQHFAELAKALDPQYISLIIPSRWFSGGRENLLADFRAGMLTDRSLRKMYAYADSQEIFPTVDIKGGLCYYLRDKSYDGDCEFTLVQGDSRETDLRNLGAFEVLIRNSKLAGIVEKVMSQTDKEKCVNTIISGDTPFGIPTNPKGSTKYSLPVYDECSDEHDTILLFLDKTGRTTAWVNQEDIKKNSQDIGRAKVFIPKASGSGIDANVLGKPEYAPKNSVCSQTFLYAAFDSEIEAKNFEAYLKTKFFRALVSASKISQETPSKTYRFVPLQDFRQSWSDEVLYKRYGLSQDEIDFIESSIQAMP